jgi:predicted phosphodiesterase
VERSGTERGVSPRLRATSDTSHFGPLAPGNNVKYAILSDLHANIEALSAVLATVNEDGVNGVVCLGDIVGYNASPNECIGVVRASRFRCIAGNHDRAAVGTKDTKNFGASAKAAIEWTRDVLTDDNRDYLRSLPSTLVVDGEFLVVHGALHPDPNDDLHLSTDSRVARSFSELATGRFGSKVCFFGHTHRPVIYEGDARGFRRIERESCRLSSAAYYLINPGSVGQSRDGDERAAYALFDTATRTLELRRIEYDVESAERRARAAGLRDAPPPPAGRLGQWLERIMRRAARHVT